jgi:hypothetical protein
MVTQTSSWGTQRGGLRVDPLRNNLQHHQEMKFMLKNAVFWDVALSDSFKKRRFGGTEEQS